VAENVESVAENLTPKPKTKPELREAGVSPRCLPKSVVRKLEVSNCS